MFADIECYGFEGLRERSDSEVVIWSAIIGWGVVEGGWRQWGLVLLDYGVDEASGRLSFREVRGK